MPFTTAQIEYRARMLRELLGYSPSDRIDMSEAVQRLEKNMRGFTLEIVEDDQLPYSEAQTVVEHKLIRIRRTIYEQLVRGDPRASFTMAEEFGHLALNHRGTRNRMETRDFTASRDNPRANAEERNAKYFAAVFLAPTEGAISSQSIEDLQSKFGLSAEAARHRFDELQRERRRKSGQRRELPPYIEEDLRLLFERNGYKPRYVVLRHDVGPAATKFPGDKLVDRQGYEARIQGFAAQPCIECASFTVVEDSGCATCRSCGWTSCD
jgi:hypothetical protein